MRKGKCNNCGSTFFYLVDATKRNVYNNIQNNESVPYYSAEVFGRGKLAFCAGCGRLITRHNGVAKALIEMEEPTRRDIGGER